MATKDPTLTDMKTILQPLPKKKINMMVETHCFQGSVNG